MSRIVDLRVESVELQKPVMAVVLNRSPYLSISYLPLPQHTSSR